MTIQLIKPYISPSGKIIKPGTTFTVIPELGQQLVKDGIAKHIDQVPIEYLIKDLKGIAPEPQPRKRRNRNTEEEE